MLVEYRQRTTAGQDASAWLSEAVKQAGFDLYEKTINILEGAVFHKEDAGAVLKANVTFSA